MGVEHTVLVVEDENAQRKIIADILRREGFQVEEAASGEAALDAIETRVPDLVLSDWKLPGIGGGELLARVRSRGPRPAFIVMTAYGSIAHAMDAIRNGADDYLAKPFERDELLIAVRRVLRTTRLEDENRRLREEITGREGFGEILGKAEAMQQLFRTIRKVAATDATILVTGESGTGKELVARTLHEQSPRAERPFVALNCAAIPDTLMESELFGYEKGAFTGASQRKEGKFEEARGGTLFLDEIASMPLGLQAVLLRVLQERRFSRLGGRGEVECDVRIVAASNRDLPRMVADGAFREDLYYRLNVLQLRLPSLRERKEDIPLLARHFLARVSEKYGLPALPIPADLLRCLVSHPWPGNVRELANVMERLALMADEGRLRLQDLPDEIRAEPGDSGCPFRLPPAGLDWDGMESGLLRQALGRAGGNRSNAARLLGMSYKTFLYRLEKFGLH
ncbi:MAG: sigma-54-dependent Fis family transcriptional regulator [Acidobacteria bacterium]|nr:sigma-54-dependent Fis family transcriptional regulator [Acidobacteriota bacterium]